MPAPRFGPGNFLNIGFCRLLSTFFSATTFDTATHRRRCRADRGCDASSPVERRQAVDPKRSVGLKPARIPAGNVNIRHHLSSSVTVSRPSLSAATPAPARRRPGGRGAVNTYSRCPRAIERNMNICLAAAVVKEGTGWKRGGHAIRVRVSGVAVEFTNGRIDGELFRRSTVAAEPSRVTPGRRLGRRVTSGPSPLKNLLSSSTCGRGQ
jgi:hypothetical protein